MLVRTDMSLLDLWPACCAMASLAGRSSTCTCLFAKSSLTLSHRHVVGP